MSHYFHYPYRYAITPPAPGASLQLSFDPTALYDQGFNLMLELSTASALLAGANPPQIQSATVIGHVDTGATNTCIDDSLAVHLGLTPLGQTTTNTASGPRQCNTYSIDVSFPGAGLKPRQNLRVTGVNLSTFNLAQALSDPGDLRNFGVLIGRDIMSSWHITWHGPTSCVLVSD